MNDIVSQLLDVFGGLAAIVLAILYFRLRWVVLPAREREARKRAVARSTAVTRGQAFEHLAPFMDDFGYNPRDARFLGSPIDLVVFDGLSESLSHREMMAATRERWGMRPLQILAIVPTMFRPNTLVHQENLRQLRERFGEQVWPPIALRTIWAEASTVGQLIFRFAPQSPAAADAETLVARTCAWLTEPAA